jgi:dihydroorotate dehydrogenase subfamily 2
VDYLYRQVLKPLLFLLPPELVHEGFISLGQFLGWFKPGFWLIDFLYNYRGSKVAVTVDGLTYGAPVMLAAGFDYNARLINILPALGLGGVEVGSVTARPCAGNPKPRLTRLPHSQSIIVNKGLKNEGVEVVAKRLAKYKRRADFIVGVSIARTNDEFSNTMETGVADYLFSLKTLVAAGVGDYYTINISCPNAFGGETFTKPELLDLLLKELKTVAHNKPLYVKMPLNLTWAEFEPLLQIIIKHQFNGVIIGNLTKNYDDLADQSERPAAYGGGLSGAPCRSRAQELVEQAVAAYGDKLTVIGCGGIFSAADALAYFDRGAKLTQLITGLIYEGPGLIKKIAAARATKL